MKRIYDEILTGGFNGLCIGFIGYIIFSLLGIHNEYLFSLNHIYLLPVGDITTMLNCFVMGVISGIVFNIFMPMFHFTTFSKGNKI